MIAGLPPTRPDPARSFATVALSAVASNTATIAVMLVVLRDAAAPTLHSVLFAATIASSCDFALPAGTPPNAIVFGSGYVRIPTMARLGVGLDLVAALVCALWCWWVVPRVL
ncbi:MAG: anion permease [Thermoanaerobaculia bacterium]